MSVGADGVPAPTEWPTVRRVDHVMGMPISLAMRGPHSDDRTAREAWDAVMTELRQVDRVFSTYRNDSYVSRLDRGEIGVEDCPPEVVEVLRLGTAAEDESNGAFSIWLPGSDGRRHLDPNGVVKGWAIERAAVHLRELEDTDFCLSAGGDMTCHTADPGVPWRIGVEDPADPSRIVAVISVTIGAVATSGTAHRGRHLFDARTGRVPSGIAAVTVVADSLTSADIDATAAYAQGADAARWLETRPGRAALVIWSNGRTTTVRSTRPLRS